MLTPRLCEKGVILLFLVKGRFPGSHMKRHLFTRRWRQVIVSLLNQLRSALQCECDFGKSLHYPNYLSQHRLIRKQSDINGSRVPLAQTAVLM